MRYVFDSERASKLQEEILDRLEAVDSARVQDAADADEGQRRQLYNNILSPLSIINGKDLSVFRADDGSVTFEAGVLITPDTFYVGDEALEFLDSKEA